MVASNGMRFFLKKIMNMKIFFSLIILVLFFPRSAQAVLPPDFIFSIGSQLTQILAAIGVFFIGAVMGILPFIRRFGEVIRSRKVMLISVGATLSFCALLVLIGIRTGYFHQGPKIITPVDNTSITGYRFFSDRFVIAGEPDDEGPLLFDLIINRKESLQGGFDHYYLGNIIAYGKNGKFYKEKLSTNEDIIPDLLFSSFKKVEATDHSSRYKYFFTFSLLGRDYEVVTDEFTSDFIMKNDIDYTEYTSTGNAKVNIDGKISSAHIMHQGIYSNDYRPKVFFDSGKEIHSKTIQLILWDEEGTFLLVDKSNVFEVSDAYSSHFWGLMKDKDGNTRKAFSGQLDKKIENGVTMFQSIIPNFNTNFSAELITSFKKGLEKGWVEAVVTTDSGTRQFYGLGYYHEYGVGNEL